MTLGIVMLVHTALDRVEQVARHWSAAGCPVVIHVDKKVPNHRYDALSNALSDRADIHLSPRYRCEWGTWGIVAATQAASELILEKFTDVHHVYLMSGSCLPLRPVQELVDYLAARSRTDFIESATTTDVPWAVGGLDMERFTLRFPFSWKKNRRLFDKVVDIQRRLRMERKLPEGVVPHLGSQWWCLTRQTLSGILQDPRRPLYDRFFRNVWIPDESYFQSLARRYSTRIESRSLTLSKFDYQGKPHTFYDDHLQLLRRSDCFVARKIWPGSEALYNAFLTDPAGAMKKAEPNPGKIDRVFARADAQRIQGRPGLYMQSRFPKEDWENGMTAAPFSVFQGFAELFENFEPWLTRETGACVHGHLFAPGKVNFAKGQTVLSGALTDNVRWRDYNPHSFLTNLIWNARGERQCFQFGPEDNQQINWRLAKDPNAQISVITGAWSIPLFRSNRNFSDIRKKAALLQKIESDHMGILRSPYTKARVRIWTMAEFIDAPMEALQDILAEIIRDWSPTLTEAPKMVDLTGFGQFLQNLKNQGMHPYLMGNFPVGAEIVAASVTPRKPYLVR